MENNFNSRTCTDCGNYINECACKFSPGTYPGDIIEEAGPCRECSGSGLYAQATWNAPADPCEECNGTGYDQEEEEERQKLMDQRRAAEQAGG